MATVDNCIYKRKFGEYYFYMDGEEVFHTRAVYVCFSPETSTMYCHGPNNEVQKEFDSLQKALPDVMIFAFPVDYPVEEINNMIKNNDTVNSHIRKAVTEEYEKEDATIIQ